MVQPSPQLPSDTCTHERGPGTTVCLHCRREARMVASEKRRRLLLRGGATTIVLATLGTAAALGASAMRAKAAAKVAKPAVNVPAGSSPVVPEPRSSTPDSSAVSAVPPVSNTVGATTVSAVSSPAPGPAVGPAPILPQGPSTLTGGIAANRSDSVVTLSFDISGVRTRRAEKFEQLVRTTLPQIYGAVADSALARIPLGELAKQGDLVNELPTRGLHIPLTSGKSVALYPVTRPGQDGPIVVQYRVSAK